LFHSAIVEGNFTKTDIKKTIGYLAVDMNLRIVPIGTSIGVKAAEAASNNDPSQSGKSQTGARNPNQGVRAAWKTDPAVVEATARRTELVTSLKAGEHDEEAKADIIAAIRETEAIVKERKMALKQPPSQ
jgi:hypothetical protein